MKFSRFVSVTLVTGVVAGSLTACATSPLGRHQFLMMNEQQMNEMGAQSYEQIKQETPLSKSQSDTAYVRCVANAITTTLNDGQQWEVNLFQDDSANAFALPGGKIGVNTGLLKVATSQDQLAAVVGHEIGHVQAQHSNERVSMQAATSTGMSVLGSVAGDGAVSQGAMAALGLGAEYGVALPFSRKHEAEADIIGLQLMAQAGFDPRASIALWQNMSKANGGNEPPEFMSTHPSNSTRIDGLGARMSEVMPKYQQARAAGRNPQCKR